MCLHLWLWKCKTCWSKLKEAWIKLSSAICDLNNVISSSWCSCSGQLTIKYAEESGRHSNWIQFLSEAENSWLSDQNVRFERKRRNMYVEVLSEKSGKREITIVVLPTTKGCLCSDRKIQDDPAVKTLTGENLFFWSFILFSETVCCTLLACYDQHSPNSQTRPPSMGLLRVRTNHIKVDTNFHHKKNEETRIVFTLNNFKVALEVPNENCMHFRFIIISLSSYFLILFDVVLVFPPQ